MSPKWKLVKERVKKIAVISSIHGLPNMVQSDNCLVRIFWILCLSAPFSYCTYANYQLFSDYFKYEVTTNIDYITDYDMDFPALTFCNLNPINYDKQEVKNILTMNNYSYYLFSDEIDLNSEISVINANVIQILSIFNVSYGFKIDDMLISCTFNGINCDKNDFFLTQNAVFGNCYKFNSGFNSTGEPQAILKSGEPGINYGLNLELFAGIAKSQPFWVTESGVIVVIHNKTITPIVKEEGFPIKSGQKSYLMFSREEMSLLGEPYSECVDDFPSQLDGLSSYALFIIRRDGQYRQITCLLECANEQSSAETSNQQLVLTLSYKFYANCVEYCPPECDQISFEIDQNLASYPNGFYFEKLKTTNALIKSLNYSSDEIKSNILSLSLNYKSMTSQVTSEVPVTTAPTLLGNFGGQLGLFLGMSLLSFMELIEMLFAIIHVYFFEKF